MPQYIKATLPADQLVNMVKEKVGRVLMYINGYLCTNDYVFYQWVSVYGYVVINGFICVYQWLYIYGYVVISGYMSMVMWLLMVYCAFVTDIN